MEPSPVDRHLALYVPNPTNPLSVAAHGLVAGSAIVGRLRPPDDPPSPRGWLRVYYEGNRHGAENIVTFADRAYHAADRLVRDYPTTAWAIVPALALVTVGTFDYRTRTISLTHEAALAAWLDCDDGCVPSHELRPSS